MRAPTAAAPSITTTSAAPLPSPNAMQAQSAVVRPTTTTIGEALPSPSATRAQSALVTTRAEAQPLPNAMPAPTARVLSTTTTTAETLPLPGAMRAPSAAAMASDATGASAPLATCETSQSSAALQTVGSATAAGHSPRMGSRHIPSVVKRGVLARDGECCSFVAPDGRRCQERGWLEFHHVVPFALGGPATTENIRLLCRAHNALLAERAFGKAFMVNAVALQQRPDATPGSERSAPLPRAPRRRNA